MRTKKKQKTLYLILHLSGETCKVRVNVNLEFSEYDYRMFQYWKLDAGIFTGWLVGIFGYITRVLTDSCPLIVMPAGYTLQVFYAHAPTHLT